MQAAGFWAKNVSHGLPSTQVSSQDYDFLPYFLTSRTHWCQAGVKWAQGLQRQPWHRFQPTMAPKRVPATHSGTQPSGPGCRVHARRSHASSKYLPPLAHEDQRSPLAARQELTQPRWSEKQVLMASLWDTAWPQGELPSSHRGRVWKGQQPQPLSSNELPSHPDTNMPTHQPADPVPASPHPLLPHRRDFQGPGLPRLCSIWCWHRDRYPKLHSTWHICNFLLLLLIIYNAWLFLQGTPSSPQKCQLTPRRGTGTWGHRSCSTSPFHPWFPEHHVTQGHSRWLASQTRLQLCFQAPNHPPAFLHQASKLQQKGEVLKTRATSVTWIFSLWGKD